MSYTVTTKPNRSQYDCSADFANTAFDKGYSYLIRKNGDNYEAVSGATGRLVYGGSDDEGGVDGSDDAAVIAAVLAAVSSGVVLLNGVAFDLTQFGDIPEDVQVHCSYNAEYHVYINSADSSGSPYTVSVGSGVNVGYYLTADSEGRICFTSVNFKSVYDAVSAVLTVDGGTVVLRAGDVFVSSVGLSGVSNVSVEGYGATLQVQSNTGGVHALTFDSIVNSVWRGVNVVRVGVDAGSSHVLFVSGVTDESVRFLDCNFTNLVSGTATGCYGVIIWGSSASSFSDCVITGGDGGSYCYGVSIGGSSASSFSDCVITGGDGGSYCYGVSIGGSSACPSFSDCTITGGSGGTYCNGVYLVDSACSFSACTITGGDGGSYCNGVISVDSACPSFSDCTITGGSGGSYCYGVIIWGSSASSFSDCVITGGDGGSYCYGVSIGGSSASSFSDCTITGGSGGSYCNGVYSYGSSACSFSACTIDIQTFSSSWSYSSADDGRFQPFSTHPYILRGIYVKVASATSGVTLDLGTTVSGTEIASGINISSTGAKYFNFTSPVEVAGDGYFYATPSGATANDAFTVYYIVSTNYATSYGAVIDTKGYMLMSGCTVVANGASDALRINSNSVSYPYFKVTNCHLESLDATNQYAVSASGALADAPIYNSVLVHNLLNVTPDAGTQQGTNWQDPLVAYEEALPLKNEYVTKLLNLVAKERLDHTTLYFTSVPLTDLVSVEGLEGKDLDNAVSANKDIEVQNALLIKEAKSLAQIVFERTDKTVKELVPVKEKITPVYLEESPIKKIEEK